MTQLKAVDFFCGGGGMTCGLKQAGISVLAGIDFDKEAQETYEYNNSPTQFIYSDITKLPLRYLEEHLGVEKNDDTLIFVGCSPCQFYSIINTDKKKSQKTKDLLKNFVQFVDYYRPGFVLVENVPGIVTHKDSVLPSFLEKLELIGYRNIVSKILNLSRYGVPQTRTRFSLIATRLNDIELKLPEPDEKESVLKDFLGPKNNFSPVRAGHKDLSDFNHTVAGLSEICLKRLAKTRHNGGNRFDWADDPELQLPCFVGKNDSFKDTFGRLWWERPASTITTKFFSISNGRFAHPEEDRALSLREGATLQTFPLNYVFKTKSISSTARLIGNAVPCEFARRLGETLKAIERSNGKI